MPKVAVPLLYFDFFPDIKAELAARYPGAKFSTPGVLMQGPNLIEFLKGYDTAVIGLNRFTDEVCAALPELKVVSLCSAGVDHIDPVILNKYRIKMWWVPGINKISVSELAVCYMVLTVNDRKINPALISPRRARAPVASAKELAECA